MCVFLLSFFCRSKFVDDEAVEGDDESGDEGGLPLGSQDSQDDDVFADDEMHSDARSEGAKSLRVTLSPIASPLRRQYGLVSVLFCLGMVACFVPRTTLYVVLQTISIVSVV